MSQQQQEKQQGQGSENGHGKAHETTIVVNAQEKTVPEKEISFEELVSLAYDGNPPTGDNWEFTVTYRRGHGEKPQGQLVAGESVKVKEGMVFDVYGTDKS
jgi:hypothetical protein